MKKIWKWILGIVVVLALLVAAGFVIHAFGGRFMYAQAYNQQVGGFYHNGPMMRSFDGERLPFESNRAPMDNFNRRFTPMMNVRAFGGFSPFFGGFMLLGGLFRLVLPLGIVALVAWFAYQQGKKDGMKSVAAVAAAAPAAPATPEADTPSQEA